MKALKILEFAGKIAKNNLIWNIIAIPVPWVKYLGISVTNKIELFPQVRKY